MDPWGIDLSDPARLVRSVNEGDGMLRAASAGHPMLHPGASFPPSLGYRPAGFWGGEIEGGEETDVKFASAGWSLYLPEERKTIPLIHAGEDVDVAEDKTETDRSATGLWNTIVNHESGGGPAS